jgi:hypothetical protein
VLVSEADVAAHPSLGQGAADLERRVENALTASGRFKLVRPAAGKDRRGAPTVALRLDGATVVPAAASGAAAFRAVVGVELALVAGERRLEAGGRGEAPFPPGDLDARGIAFQTALDRALDDAVAGLVARDDAAGAPEEALIAELSGPDPARRDVALRLLVERKSKAAVEPLLARLADPDPEEVLRAASALAAIGDARAVPALIEAAARRDPPFLARLAVALGDLGGPEAEAYLFTTAGGHPDPGVRAAAEEALATLRANRRRAPAPDPREGP